MARNKPKFLRFAGLVSFDECGRETLDCTLTISKLLLKGGPIIGLVSCIIMTPTRGLAEAALAYGHYGNGGWASGTAYNYRTGVEAQNHAMSNCNAKGRNCAIRITFRNTCVALAVQNGGNGWGTGLHTDINEARRMALARCAQYGRSCSVQTAFCDNVSEAAIREAEQEKARRENDEYQEYVRLWRVCFDGSIAENAWDSQIQVCSQAIGYPRGSFDDRIKLTKRRDDLMRARDDASETRQRRAREIADEAARQATQRARDAENAAREAELRAQNAPAGLHISPNSNTAVVAGIVLVGFMAWAFSLTAKLVSSDKPSFGRQVAVQSVATIISGIVLYQLGIVNEVKLLVIPLVGGLSVALYSSFKLA